MKKKNQLKSCCKKMLSSREVVARDLPHPMPLSLLNRKQQPYFMREAEDPGTLRAAKLSGMTTYFYNDYRGFTLIELLVVVLIIGILAAVALPQYQKAVWKSRFATIKALTKSFAEAEEAYYLANGVYTTDIDALSLDMPKANSSYEREDGYTFYFYNWGRVQITSSHGYVQSFLYDRPNSPFLSYKIMLPLPNGQKKQTRCYAESGSPVARAVCKSDGGKNIGDREDDFYY